MTGSYAFFLHIVGVGLVCTSVLGRWTLERRFRKEDDVKLRLHTTSLIRSIGLLSPSAVVLLILTGVANIINVFAGTSAAWYSQPWLVTKLVLFAILVVNGMLPGPLLIKKRERLLPADTEDAPSGDWQIQVSHLNKQISWYYLVQSLLILSIIYLSAFGSSKHPGFI